MTTREEFIGAVTKILGRPMPTEQPQLHYRHAVHTDVMKEAGADELAAAFIEYSKTIGAEVVETSRGELDNALTRLADELAKEGGIVVADDPLLNEIKLAETLARKHRVHTWDVKRSWHDNIGFAEKAAVGIAVAKMALAESATVLLFSHGGCGRSVTLLPKSTIYIVPRSVIKPRLTQAMAFVREQRRSLPSSINFVSGPSATADIELVRVVGVHGPVRVAHVVVGDM